MTEEFFYTSNPTFTVDEKSAPELNRDLVRLDVHDSISGLKSLCARFQAVGPDANARAESVIYLDGRLIDFGQALSVTLGPLSNRHTVFEGVVSAIEIQYEEGQEPEFLVKAEDSLMDFRMTRRCATYEGMSDAEIAAEIAEQHGLETDIDAEGPTLDRIQQLNMSDLAFLRERARQLQAEIWVSGRTFHYKTRDRRNTNDVNLIRGNDLIAVKACADLAHQRTAVRCTGYDANDRVPIDELAEEGAVSGEFGAGKSGIQVLAQSFGERTSHRVKEVPIDTVEATEWARSELLRRARSFVTVNGMSRGTPELQVGSGLTLEQMGTPFEGDSYYVTKTQHTFDLTEGHRTHFEAERATVSSYA